MVKKSEQKKKQEKIPKRLVMYCQSQLYARGTSEKAYACEINDPQVQLFCTAHLAEGRAFPCPYNPREIFLERRTGRYRMQHRNGARCEDFELPEGYDTSRIKKV